MCEATHENSKDLILSPNFFRNPLVPCDAITIPRINLLPWKEGLQIFQPSTIIFNQTESQRQPIQESLNKPLGAFNIEIDFDEN